MNKSFLKRWFILFLTFFLFLLGFLVLSGRKKPVREAEIFFTAPIEDEAVFYFSPEEETYSVGQTFPVQVKLATVETTTNIVIATAVLNFDKDILKVNNLTGSSQFSNQMQLNYDNNTGLITIKQGVGGGDPAVSGEVDFAVIEFEAITESGQTDVIFNEQDSSAASDQAEYLDKSFYNARYEILQNGGGKEGHFYLDPETKTVTTDEIFDSFIKIDTDGDIVIATANLSFDPQFLQVVDLAGSDQFTNNMIVDFDNTNGTITVKQGVGGLDPAVSGDFIFATVEFEIIGQSGQTDVVFNEGECSIASAGAEYLTLEFTKATYAIGGATPSPTPTDSPERDYCCEGLTEISNKTESDWPNCNSDGISFMCAYCNVKDPDGVKRCGLGENCCNCEADCGSCGEVSPTPTLTSSPTPTPTTTSSPSPSGEATPTPTATPGPGNTTINLKVRFEGVPANELDMNLPDVNRQKEALVTIQKERDGSTIYSEYLVFDYQGNGVWGTALSAFIPPLMVGGWDLNEYVIKIKGQMHRQILYCSEEQEPNYSCKRTEGIFLDSYQTWDLDFSERDEQKLEFGDVYTEVQSNVWAQNGQVNVLDYSFIKMCAEGNANIVGNGGQAEIDFYESAGKWADGNFDGSVDNYDIQHILRTLSIKTDDE